MDNRSKLIKIYEIKYHCQRLSNNSNPEFTDQEVMTISGKFHYFLPDPRVIPHRKTV